MCNISLTYHAGFATRWTLLDPLFNVFEWSHFHWITDEYCSKYGNWRFVEREWNNSEDLRTRWEIVWLTEAERLMTSTQQNSLFIPSLGTCYFATLQRCFQLYWWTFVLEMTAVVSSLTPVVILGSSQFTPSFAGKPPIFDIFIRGVKIRSQLVVLGSFMSNSQSDGVKFGASAHCPWFYEVWSSLHTSLNTSDVIFSHFVSSEV